MVVSKTLQIANSALEPPRLNLDMAQVGGERGGLRCPPTCVGDNCWIWELYPLGFAAYIFWS